MYIQFELRKILKPHFSAKYNRWFKTVDLIRLERSKHGKRAFKKRDTRLVVKVATIDRFVTEERPQIEIWIIHPAL